MNPILLALALLPPAPWLTEPERQAFVQALLIKRTITVCVWVDPDDHYPRTGDIVDGDGTIWRPTGGIPALIAVGNTRATEQRFKIALTDALATPPPWDANGDFRVDGDDIQPRVGAAGGRQ